MRSHGQAGQGQQPTLRSRLLLEVRAELDEPQNVGETPLGGRRIYYFRRGSFGGPGLRGDLLPGGGDWVLVRPDGVAQLDIRFTLRTDDGALIYARSNGILDMAPDVRWRVLAGEDVDPAEYYFRTTVAFETAAEEYRGLTRLLAVGVGRRTSTGMVTEVFAID